MGMSRIAAVATALPPHRHRQADLADATAGLLGMAAPRRRLLDRLYANAGVETRHTALPLADYRRLDHLGTVNDQYVKHAADLGEEAVRRALTRAGAAAGDVGLFVVTSVTGVAVPSLDALLMPRLGLRATVKRVPVFGLGCVAGAAGLARIHDYLLAWPAQTAVLLSVELCSLSVPLSDPTTGDLVVSALFGDGAGAVVVRGTEAAAAAESIEAIETGGVTAPAGRGAAGPRIVATHSEVCPDTHDVLGWRLGPSGFRIVLTTELSDVVRDALGPMVKGFLAEHGLQVPDVAAWICHPGGPKVIDAVRDALGLDEKAVRTARASLSEVGNLSSASVLHVLEKTLADRPVPGTPGLLIGLGPGVSVELVLLEW
jgi:alkylresorcinol/alkylpyrone synthase